MPKNRKKIKKQNNRRKNAAFVNKKKLLGKIRKGHDPILHNMCEDVANIEEGLEIARDMIEVLAATETGVGLAAPQVGYNKKVVLLRPDPDMPKSKIRSFINPEIIDKSESKTTLSEGCLSYPDTFTETSRYDWISVEYDTDEGKKVEKFTGWEAVIMQHEIDHLFGNCVVYEEWKAIQGELV